MKNKAVLHQWTWVKVLDFAWKLFELAEKKLGSSFDCRTVELLYGPATAEALIRHFGEAVGKLLPTVEKIEQAYLMFGGKSEKLQILRHLTPAGELAADFAKISGDKNVAVGAGMSSIAQVICVLAHTLPPVARQNFQQAFVWDGSRRASVFNDDEIDLWHGLEREVGMGICASIFHAKQVIPDLTPEEFGTAMLRKYGIPIYVDGQSIYACHWCGTGPCSCGGGKAPTRRVTYEDAARNLDYCGPVDTQEGMYFPYAWANIARGGAGYGPLRALIEAATEKGAVLADKGSQKNLEQRFGPLLIPQQRHIAEIIQRFGRSEDTTRRAHLSELADAVHWQYAGYGPGVLDHTAGLKQALTLIGDYCGVKMEFPPPSWNHPL